MYIFKEIYVDFPRRTKPTIVYLARFKMPSSINYRVLNEIGFCRLPAKKNRAEPSSIFYTS